MPANTVSNVRFHSCESAPAWISSVLTRTRLSLRILGPIAGQQQDEPPRGVNVVDAAISEWFARSLNCMIEVREITLTARNRPSVPIRRRHPIGEYLATNRPTDSPAQHGNRPGWRPLSADRRAAESYRGQLRR